MASRDWIRHFGSALMASALAGWIGFADYASAYAPTSAGTQPTLPHSHLEAPGLALKQVYSEAAAWRGAEAKQVRNAMIANWLGGLYDAGMAEYSVRHMDKGLIYAIRFRSPIDGDDIHALWVAVPDGPDLPSSVLLRTPHRGAADLTILELQSCTSRRTLQVSVDVLPTDLAEARAVSQLSTYLDAPDPMPITVLSEARDICRQISRMLPTPER
jgi:hypothetical protein